MLDGERIFRQSRIVSAKSFGLPELKEGGVRDGQHHFPYMKGYSPQFQNCNLQTSIIDFQTTNHATTFESLLPSQGER